MRGVRGVTLAVQTYTDSMWNVGVRLQAGLCQNRERERAGHIPREQNSRSLALSVLITQGEHARD